MRRIWKKCCRANHPPRWLLRSAKSIDGSSGLLDDPELESVALARMEGYTVEEIAASLGSASVGETEIAPDSDALGEGSRLLSRCSPTRQSISLSCGRESLLNFGETSVKSFTEYLTFNIPSKMAFENITPQVEERSARAACRRASCWSTRCTSRRRSSSTTTNAACTTTSASGSKQLAPFNPDPNHYHHNRTGEDNADAHLKRQIMGREVVVAITKGKLDFGPWEQIFYGEFDGNRAKRVLVKVIGE